MGVGFFFLGLGGVAAPCPGWDVRIDDTVGQVQLSGADAGGDEGRGYEYRTQFGSGAGKGESALNL